MQHSSSAPRTQVTQILARIGEGQSSAAAELLPLVYDELRRLAQSRLAKEAPGQTLQPTALVHEAYMRLVDDSGKAKFNSRGHFFAAAAEAMRRILIERARRRAAEKHGGGATRVPLMDVPDWTEPEPEQMLALDAALQQLAQSDRRLSEVVMFRYFAGLTIEQTAEAMNSSPATVKRDWNYARAWLFDHVAKATGAEDQ
jgi:RNA polymerase sigma factor (TIGR02999 family)